MTLDGTDSDAVALPCAENPYVLVFDLFHSKNPARKDPRKLPAFKDISTSLRIFAVRSVVSFFLTFALNIGIRRLDQTTWRLFRIFKHLLWGWRLSHLSILLSVFLRSWMNRQPCLDQRKPKMRLLRYTSVSRLLLTWTIPENLIQRASIRDTTRNWIALVLALWTNGSSWALFTRMSFYDLHPCTENIVLFSLSMIRALWVHLWKTFLLTHRQR